MCALPHLLFHLEPILCKCGTFSRLELPAALLQVSKLLAFLPSLLGYFLIFFEYPDITKPGLWLVALPTSLPPRLPYLGLEHYEGLGIILVYCWPQVKLLVLPTTSHAQAHPPRSAAVRNGFDLRLNLQVYGHWPMARIAFQTKASYSLHNLYIQCTVADLEFWKGGFQYAIKSARSTPARGIWGACPPR